MKENEYKGKIKEKAKYVEIGVNLRHKFACE
jgi:hypothetical protein